MSDLDRLIEKSKLHGESGILVTPSMAESLKRERDSANARAEAAELKLEELGIQYNEMNEQHLAQIEQVQEQLSRAVSFLRRYHKETPLGHQPSMITLDVEQFIDAIPPTDLVPGGVS